MPCEEAMSWPSLTA